MTPPPSSTRPPPRWLHAMPRRDLPQAWSAARRTDLYWNPLFEGWAIPHWDIGAQVAYRCRQFGVPMPHPMAESTAIADRHVRGNVATVTEVLGALHGWRTATTEQLVSIVGAEHDDSLASTLAACWRLGLIDLAHHPRLERISLGPTAIWRIGSEDAYAANLAAHLSPAKRFAITGGLAWGSGPDYARHNLLTTELALRAAEHVTGVVAIAGEAHCRLSALVPLADDSASEHGARADAALIMGDGTTIAIEVTTTVGTPSAFLRKVERWTKRLSQQYPSGRETRAPTRVLFVIADELRPSGTRSTLRDKVARIIEQAVRTYPGTSIDRTADRIGIVHWQDWFPADGQRSKQFDALAVFIPPRPDPDADDKQNSEATRSGPKLWRSRDWNGLTTSGGDAPDSTAVLHHLAQSPAWMRRPDRPSPALLAPVYERIGLFPPFRLQERPGSQRQTAHPTSLDGWWEGHSRIPDNMLGVRADLVVGWPTENRTQDSHGDDQK